MSTRSLLCKLLPDGRQFLSVYARSDGYLEWTGRLLQQFHATPEAVDRLLQKDISGLGCTGGVDYCTDATPPEALPLSRIHEVAHTCGAEWIYLWQPIAGTTAWAWHVACDRHTAERRLDWSPCSPARYTPRAVLQDKLNNLGAYVEGASTAEPAATPAAMFHPHFR